jgi:hypothetical protein
MAWHLIDPTVGYPKAGAVPAGGQRQFTGDLPALVVAASLDGRQGLYKRARVQYGSGSDGNLLRSRHLHARDVDSLDERPDVVRPWTCVVLRVPS